MANVGPRRDNAGQNTLLFMKDGVLVEAQSEIDKCSVNLRKRFEELIQTESEYVQALAAITENREEILMAVKSSRKYNTEQKIEFEKALELISAMQNIHQRLIEEITAFYALTEEYLNSDGDKAEALERMREKSKDIKVLSNISNAYVIEYTSIYHEGILDLFAKEGVIRKKTRDQIDEHLKRNAYIQKQNSNIDHLWIQPVQRTARYPLLFGDITKDQNPDNPFANILKDMHEFFKNYAQKSDQALSHRQSEAKRYMYTTRKSHNPKLKTKRDLKIISPLGTKAKTIADLRAHINQIATIEGHSFTFVTEVDDALKPISLIISDESNNEIMKIHINQSSQIEIEFMTNKNLDYHALEIAQGILQSINAKHEYIKAESRDPKMSELIDYLKQIKLDIEPKRKPLLIANRQLPIQASDKMETLLLDYRNISIHSRYERAGGKNAPKGSIRAGQIELLERIIRDLTLDKSYSNREKEMILAGVLENYQTQLAKDQKNSKLFKVVSDLYNKLPKEAKNQLAHPASKKFIVEKNIYEHIKNKRGADAMKAAFETIDKSNTKKNRIR